MTYSADIKKVPRHFLPENFVLKDWASIEPFFKELEERETGTIEQLEKWLKDIN